MKKTTLAMSIAMAASITLYGATAISVGVSEPKNVLGAGEDTVKIYLDASYANWSVANAHYWGTGITATTWPGVAMSAVEGENQVYTVDVPTGDVSFVFNNIVSGNGKQTVNVTDRGEYNLYKINGESDGKYTGYWSTYAPESAKYEVTLKSVIGGNIADLGSVEVVEGTTYSTEGAYEWGYVFSGWYTDEACTVAAGAINANTTLYGKYDVSTNYCTIYFTDAYSYGNKNAFYSFGGNGALGAWPGALASSKKLAVETTHSLNFARYVNSDGSVVTYDGAIKRFKFYLDGGDNKIILNNNNGGTQTANLTLAGAGENMFICSDGVNSAIASAANFAFKVDAARVAVGESGAWSMCNIPVATQNALIAEYDALGTSQKMATYTNVYQPTMAADGTYTGTQADVSIGQMIAQMRKNVAAATNPAFNVSGIGENNVAFVVSFAAIALVCAVSFAAFALKKRKQD